MTPSFYVQGETPPQQLSPLLSPVRIRAVAHLYGVETVALQQARVLEIDCGLGNNLLPFALAYPEATVIGIALDAEDCLAGQELARNMGADNLHLYALSLEQIDANIGQYDYIIIRRLYGTLAIEAADALLQTCADLLGPQGIACVGYDIYPGAKMVEVVRDAMLMHAHNSSDPAQILAQAEAATALFNEGMAQANPQARALENTAKQLANQLRYEGVDAVLANPATPRYFIEFAGQAAQAGLDYVGDSNATQDLAEGWGGNVQLTNSLLGLGQGGAMRLQYLDLSTGRSVRHSLLVPATQGMGPRYQPDLEKLTDLSWAAGWKRDSWGLPDDEGCAVFVNHQGRKYKTSDMVGTLILDVLALAWPGSVSFSALRLAVERISAESVEDSSEMSLKIRSSLLRFMRWDIVHYCLGSGPYDTSISKDVSLLSGISYLIKKSSEDVRNSTTIESEKTWFPFNLWGELLKNDFDIVERQGLRGIIGDDRFLNLAKQEGIAQAFEPFADTGLVIKTDALLQAELISKLSFMGGVLADPENWREFLLKSLKQFEGAVPYWGLYLSSIERCLLQEGATESMDVAESPLLTPQQMAQLNRAEKLLAEFNYGEAEVLTRQFIKRSPDFVRAHVMLARCQAETGRYTEAFSTMAKIASRNRWKVDALVELVTMLFAQRLQSEAVQVGRLALMQDASDGRMLNNLGLICMHSLQLQEAEQYFSVAIKENPDIFTARINQIAAFSRQGRVREGVDAAYKALRDREHLQSVAYREGVYGNLLFLSNYDPDRSAEEIFQDYKKFEEDICKPLYVEWKRHKNNRSINRRLRIGYVSADYRNHAVAKFLESVFELHDRSEFEIFAYSDVKVEDAVTERFKELATEWISIVGLDDASVAARIRADEIDVLIDLSGHTAGNRLRVFARKPAPVSATWLGYGYTTGVSAIDYFIGDQYFCPPGCENIFAEKIWRLPHCFAAYRAKWDDINTHLSWGAPAVGNDYITFTSLSRSIRINKRVIRAWAEILERVPKSRLIINSASYADSQVCDEFRRQFMDLGVSSERLLLGYDSPPWKSLGMTDIGLDCFPHNSGTTLMDMLCMNVPYVTLADRPSVGRMGASFLHAAGCQELIAENEGDYVEKAVSLANDLERLGKIRDHLSGYMKNSPLLDEAGFVRDLETAYKAMFSKWAKE
ncbi:methyltransferase regulatory domain-containing protein [Achromobacter sp. F4_2707]|uniref:O-linked N-acetylglucosamine transferase family protein n=1 Tax=Achromobacter sp. F4_2707 TaxID=3114286 RepID=UPI0039C670B7